MSKFLIFDLETTGLDYKSCAIIQLAGYVVYMDEHEKFSILDKFNYNIRPFENASISDDALKINKITIEELIKYPKQQDVFNQFLALLSKYIDTYDSTDKLTLVGYNSLHFDQDFLKVWFERNNHKFFFSYFWSNGIDILSDASKYLIHYRPALPNFKLSTVAKALDITVDKISLHDGLYDATITLKLFVKLFHAHNILAWNEETAIKLFNKFQQERNEIKLNNNKK